jgi:Glycogen recognition site of AMP-activated protein kinase
MGSDERDDLTPDETAFAERVAGPLRRTDKLDASFGERLMQAVRTDAVAGVGVRIASWPGWWQEPRTLRLSPLAGLGIAAGFAALVALGTLQVARHTSPGILAIRQVHDTVHVVRFVFRDSNVKAVALVGDFNGWSVDATPLEPTGVDGVWAVTVPLPRGRYEYAFVSGGTWRTDPMSPSSRDDFDTESSVLFVGGAPCDAARSGPRCST